MYFGNTVTQVEMTYDLAEESETESASSAAAAAAAMQFTRAKSSHLPLASILNSSRGGGGDDDGGTCSNLSSSLYNSSGSQLQRRKLFLAPPKTTFVVGRGVGKGKTNYSSSSSSTAHVLLVTLLVTIILCDLLTSPAYSSPLPSSSAWSLPTLNYLFKDTKTRSQSTQYKRENENGQSHKPSNFQSASSPGIGGNLLENGNNEDGNSKVSSTGRLISAHDIRLTDNWGWARRGDPQTTTEQRRKQNIRHSKSKHKQRHHYASSPSYHASSGSGGTGSRGRKKDRTDNLLCPFDEIRGPDGKCRKAPRFSLYRVGRK